MDRKAELEKKKLKLAALREEKERRRREKEAKDVEDASGRVSIGGDKENRRFAFILCWFAAAVGQHFIS